MAITPPSASKARPRKRKSKRKRKSSGRSRSRSTVAKARTKAAKESAVVAGELLGSGAVWSGASAWRAAQGKDLKIPVIKTDARIVTGVAGLVAGLWWPKSKWSSHAVNVSLGTLGSWVHEYSYEMGAKWGEKGESAPAASAATSQGVVLGALDEDYDDEEEEDESGLFGRRQRIQRIGRKLSRLRSRRGRLQHQLGYDDAQQEPQMVQVPLYAVRPRYRRQLAL